MQFHVRQKDGGTVIARNGHISKVNLKAEGVLSPGVYPSWHPTEDLIAYSLNSTRQYFYSKGIDKTEVIDSDSDLILYDPAENKATVVAADTSALETFPSWAPDGKTLYYVSADITALAPMRQYYYGPHYDELKYNLMRIPFDPATRTFGEKETFFDAAALDKSATFPRVSPDGRYLLFTMAGFGQFHIWHRDADLFLSDLATGEWRRLENVNSEETESYHCWSSDGRWIVFSSRRGDRTYTRLYLAWFDGEGHAHKPFLLPHRNPERHDGLFKSYNIPEFTKEPVTISPKRFLKAVKGEAIQAQR
ncbi:MAG: PD40 domain-containing protein, partial [Bacteroidales bacterium]|nr:PD40 domain-containing protein [Bacteroidales bacterium]